MSENKNFSADYDEFMSEIERVISESPEDLSIQAKFIKAVTVAIIEVARSIEPHPTPEQMLDIVRRAFAACGYSLAVLAANIVREGHIRKSIDELIERDFIPIARRVADLADTEPAAPVTKGLN